MRYGLHTAVASESEIAAGCANCTCLTVAVGILVRIAMCRSAAINVNGMWPRVVISVIAVITVRAVVVWAVEMTVERIVPRVIPWVVITTIPAVVAVVVWPIAETIEERIVAPWSPVWSVVVIIA